MKELSLENKIYLCKYHDIDTSLPTTLNLTVKEINKVLAQLKRDGLYEQFRNLTEKEYDTLVKIEKKTKKIKKVKEVEKPKNKLVDLNEILFDELGRLMNNKMTQEELNTELQISKQVVNVSQTIINNASMLLQAKKYFDTTEEKEARIIPLLSLNEENE